MAYIPTGGKRGPAPAPTKMKLLHGVDKNQPGRVNRREPNPSGEAEPPEYLSTPALQIWDSVAPSMIRLGILTPWDVPLFAELCEALVIVRLARVNVMREASGDLVVASGAASPATAWLKAMSVVSNLAGRFGMSPADRSRLVMPDGGSRDVNADLLSG